SLASPAGNRKPDFRRAFACVCGAGGLAASRYPHTPGPQPSRRWGSSKLSESRSLPLTVFLFPSSLPKRAWRRRLETENPTFVGLSLVFVEPEGFEPSSRDGTIYAFYMLSYSFIVGKGKVSS